MTQSEELSMVACLRLTALGDVTMMARSLWALRELGHTPLLITRAGPASIAKHMTGLHHLLVQEDSSWTYFQRPEGGRHSDWTLEPFPSVRATLQSAKALLDFQNTSRSQKATRELRQLGLQPRSVLRIEKQGLQRAWLLLRARLSGQGEESPSLPNAVKPPTAHRVFHSHEELLRAALTEIGDAPNESFDLLSLTQGRSLLETPPEDSPLTARDLSGQPLPHRPEVILFPGASLPLKAWPMDNCRDFAQSLISAGHSVLVLGGQEESSFAQELQRQVPGLLAAAGNNSLEESLALLSAAKVVVTTDSFPAHVRDLMDKDTFVLFGATSPSLGFTPVSPSVQTLHLGLPCSPCSRHGRGTCRFGNHACMARIDGQTLAHRVQEILKRQSNPSPS